MADKDNPILPNFDIPQYQAMAAPMPEFTLDAYTQSIQNPLPMAAPVEGMNLNIPNTAATGGFQLPTWGAQPAAQPSFMDGVVGYTDNKTGMKHNGWGGLALGAATGGMNAWLGMKQLDLAKKTFNFKKDAFNLNFAQQQKTINTAMEDRQRARVAANSGAYESVGNYMKKNGV